MEPTTGLTILGTAFGSAKVIEKLLGPTAEYLGDGLRSWTEKRVINTQRIFTQATKLLGGRIESPGAVPPKVLKGILDDGSYCDDQLSAEYFGGVLASSRTVVSRDDRGSAFIALLSRLTTYQIRTHFIFYSIVKSLFSGSGISVSTGEGRNQLQTFVPENVYLPAMDFTDAEDIRSIVSHVMFGLVREHLIHAHFATGGVDIIKSEYPEATEPGDVLTPTALAVDLLLWASGQSSAHISEFFSPTIVLPDHDISIPPGSAAVEKPTKNA